MSSERWQQIEQLFHSALERELADRSEFLDEASAGDEELRKQVEALLAGHENAGSFIEDGALAVEAKELASARYGSKTNQVFVGQTISHYHIIRRLGAGAMGEVYLARDLMLGRQVALKLLPASLTGDPERLRRFEQEARSASALNHPNILTIYEISRVDSVRYIATEFVDGTTLRERISSGSIELDEVVEIAIQVAGALAAAHAKGIVHRDIKPDNIMISGGNQMVPGESRVKVLDFGIAKLTEAESMETDMPTRPLFVTSEGMTLGTAPYMSPEQAKGLKVDSRTDIWSLGVVLYEMISGRVPFEGPTRSHVIVSILEKEPPPLRELPDVPESLESIVMNALRKDRDKRYQTAREFHDDLKSLQQPSQQHLAAPPARPRVKSASSSVTAEPANSVLHTIKSSGETVSAEKKKSQVWVIASLVLVCVAVLALALKVLWPRLTAGRSAAPFGNFKVTRLTTSGKVSSAVISPDGKYAVYVKQLGAQYSLWLKHIATGSDKEIISADGSEIDSLSFSPNGNHIYFIKRAKDVSLNEIPALGGPAKRLETDIDSAVTLSPDGKRFAFIRSDLTRDEASVIIANADGTGESKLVTHPTVEMDAAAPSWSPDGERIAFARIYADARGHYRSLATVQVSDGREKKLAFEITSGIQSICWLPDGRGLLFTAAEENRKNFQIWYASFPTGTVRRITNDTNNYENVSVTADGGTLVAVLREGVSDIWVMPEGDAGSASQVTSNRFDGVRGLAWTPDGRIVHLSRAKGTNDICIMNADGSQDQSLTSDTNVNLNPNVSPDGRFIVFISNRTGGAYEIWRMDLDGRNQTQVTFGKDASDPVCSIDSKWVLFTSGGEGKNSLWKVPIAGGTATQLTNFNAMAPAVSPKDGSIAYTFIDPQTDPVTSKIGIMNANGGARLKVFDLPQFYGTVGATFYAQQVTWAPDGKALVYIDNKDAVGNLWAQPIDGGQPKQLTNFKSDMIFYYAWARDGKKLALARGTKTSDVVLLSDLGRARD